MKLYSTRKLMLLAILYSRPAPSVHPLRQSLNEKLSTGPVFRPEKSTCAPAIRPCRTTTTVRSEAEAACDGRDGFKIGAEVHGWKEDAAEVSAQVSAAKGGFHTQHNVSELLIVTNLAAAYETALSLVEPFAGEADVGPVNLTPGPADVAADVEAGPTHIWHNRISSRRSIPVSECSASA